jgi:hypothetical protein
MRAFGRAIFFARSAAARTANEDRAPARIEPEAVREEERKD